MQATRHFARTADQATAARSFVRETLRGWGVESYVDDLVLMASELFTNAVLHGDGDVAVMLGLSDEHVRLEVIDGGGMSVPTPAPAPPAHAITGRGLAIVDALAATWGNGHDARGRTRVWLEVPSH